MLSNDDEENGVLSRCRRHQMVHHVIKAHKIIHTSEKMDAINPTIELLRYEGVMMI